MKQLAGNEINSLEMNQLAGVLMAELLRAAQYILKRKQCLMTKLIQLITDLNQDLMIII